MLGERRDWKDIGRVAVVLPRAFSSSVLSRSQAVVSSSESLKTVSDISESESVSSSRSGFNQAWYQLPKNILMSELSPRYSTLRAIPSH